jgi:hypothetical protein
MSMTCEWRASWRLAGWTADNKLFVQGRIALGLDVHRSAYTNSSGIKPFPFLARFSNKPPKA